MPEKKTSPASGYQFGTFQGVFTPSILTILGVIMFLRFGWVLGNVGLPATLLIVTLATSITFLTGLSLSATATNMKVGGGGAYYLISRSLGLEIGAAIGVPLFFAQALGIAFYISGFAEAVVDVADLSSWVDALPFAISEARLVAVVTLLALTLLALVSADLALKTQLLILATIFLSLVSFFAGSTPDRVFITPETEIPAKLGFWAVFAVFFPAVTGIEAGIAMSGDLKNPAKSLPRGTMLAVLTGYAVYMTIPVFLFWVIRDERALLVRPLIMADVARWGALILVGVWAATLSSALGALLGAPRTLQALARDKVLPAFVGRGYGRKNDPRTATALSFLVALTAILLGDLDLIAPVLSMFFLTSYGLINLSAGLEGLIESPTWRPKFKFPWWGSLLGAGACLLTMMMIDLGATLTALLLIGGLYVWVKRRKLHSNWGDMRHGMLMLLVRVAIRRLLRHPPDERNWRPNILVFSGSPQSRWHLIELAAALARGPSYLTLATVLPSKNWDAERVASVRRTITEYLNKRDVEAMVKVFPAKEALKGAEALIQGYGFGPLEPNTILLGESQKPENHETYVRIVRLTQQMNRNLVMVREGHQEEVELPADPKRVDIWWRGELLNIGLMLALAYQLRRGEQWSDARLVLKRILMPGESHDEIETYLRKFIENQRLEVSFELLSAAPGDPVERIRTSSADAALVFMGLRHPEPEQSDTAYMNYYRNLIAATEEMPVVMVMSSEKLDFGQIIGLGS